MRTSLLLIVFSCVSIAFCLSTAVFPVFEQKAPPFQTYTAFPTRLCVPCRFDNWQLCLSAQLLCEEDGTATEMIWSSSLNCSGRPSRVRKVAPSEMNVRCFDQEATSPMKMDLSRFVPRLLKDHEDVFESNIQAENAIEEYKKMLFMIQVYPAASVVPSKSVDMVWHAHILDTANYTKDCNRMFGQYMHHAPSFGDAPEEKQALLTKYDQMLVLYNDLFGEAPPQVWNVRNKRNLTEDGEPNCCKAYCVKHNCAGCVGCDPVSCGTDIPPRNSSGNSMKGYVPLPDAPKENVLVGQNTTEKFTIQPLKDMNFSWSIIDYQTVQFEQILKRDAWMGFAIAKNRLGFMQYADFMVSLHGYNYTGVIDMVRPFASENFPCLDNIVECGGPIGYDDLTNKYYRRHDGYSTSRWQRLVDTNDPKDNPINTQGDTTVLFAKGHDDPFEQHRSDSMISGTIDFFAGKSSTWKVYVSEE